MKRERAQRGCAGLPIPAELRGRGHAAVFGDLPGWAGSLPWVGLSFDWLESFPLPAADFRHLPVLSELEQECPDRVFGHAWEFLPDGLVPPFLSGIGTENSFDTVADST